VRQLIIFNTAGPTGFPAPDDYLAPIDPLKLTPAALVPLNDGTPKHLEADAVIVGSAAAVPIRFVAAAAAEVSHKEINGSVRHAPSLTAGQHAR
jgi:hypothetical protein